jgi:NADPH:quinone reductase
MTVARAVSIPEPGGPEVLRVLEREVREPGPGEIRIAVRAAAVNPTDIGLRAGGAADLDPPWVPGMDAAGVVESVGDGVTRLAPGDEVMAAVTPRRADGGAQQELLVLPEASAVLVPEGASVVEAATLPMNGLTALLGLELLGLEPGQTLGVTGGAGLLGSYVAVLAKARGLRVIADAKPDDEDLVRSFGADEVVARGGFPPQGADAVFDTALLNEDALYAIRDGGGLAVVRGWSGDDSVERGIDVHSVRVATVLERTDWLEQLRQQAIPLRVAGEYPPEQAAEAHRVMDAGGLRGRAVIVF